MLLIRAAQQQVFEQLAQKGFEDEMVAHSNEFSPKLCATIGDRQLRLAIRSAMFSAQSYGFTHRGPIRLFIELMFLCGSAFDTDPQYPGIGETLRGPEDQMWRAQRLHEGHNEYLDVVSGPRAINVHNSLERLLALARSEETFSGDFHKGMLEGMRRAFPEKAAYAGEEGLMALVDEAIAEAFHYRFDNARQGALLVILKFAFGHGCTNDPLYPWIGNTLHDPKILTPAGRAARLERKATTWLEHVVAENERIVQA